MADHAEVLPGLLERPGKVPAPPRLFGGARQTPTRWRSSAWICGFSSAPGRAATAVLLRAVI
ncbi:hypothetical protein ACWGMA_37925 [Streptomyces asiaticus]